MAAAVGFGPHPGGSVPVHLNLDPIIPVIAGIISEMDLGGMFKTALDCIDSSSLANVSLVTLKCYPIVEMRGQAFIERLDNELSARMRYFEALVTGTACLVYNAVFGVVFSVISAVTFGQVRIVLDQMRKHWIHTGLAVASVGIAAAGTFSPKLGQKANIAGALGIVALMGTMAQADVVSKLTRAYERNKEALKSAVLQGLQGDRGLFDRDFAPLFHCLDELRGVHTFYDLAEVAQEVASNFPHVVPVVTPDRLLAQLGLLSTT